MSRGKHTEAEMIAALKQLEAGAAAVYNASGLEYYRHPDWLGSSRFASTPSRTMYNDLAFAPFGEQYAQAGSTGVTDTSFAGNNEDTTTNLYDAQAREYGIQGRWPSPDPAGLKAVNPSDPQTWNRYAYVRNNPLLLTDVSGTRECYTVEGVPGDTSQQTSGYGPYDAGDEMYAPLEGGGGGEGCGGFDSPFGGGSGDDQIGMDSTFGCTEFDSINPSSGCAQALNWFANPDWSPWNIQYTGPASDGQPVTFDIWDQYANWRTTVAAGAPDPCVYLNDSATAVQDIDVNSNPTACALSPGGGGNWVPTGFGFYVDKETGTLVVTSFVPSPGLPSPGTYGDYLACASNAWLSQPGTIGAIGGGIWASSRFFVSGREVSATISLVTTTAVAWGESLKINVACSQQVYGR
jgi:RHS repeat-associated protein